MLFYHVNQVTCLQSFYIVIDDHIKECSLLPVYAYPSCLQTTVASVVSQESSHTVPHWSLMHTSTLPSYWLEPPTRRTSPYVQLPLVLTVASNQQAPDLTTFLNIFTHKHDSTLTSHSGTLTIVTTNEGAVWAVSEINLTATTVNIIKIDWTSSRTEFSITEGDYTCGYNRCQIFRELYS